MPALPTEVLNDDLATSPRRLQLDASGRAIPLTDAERADDIAAALAALAATDAIPDDPPGSDEECWRAIDEGRSERPLFRGMY